MSIRVSPATFGLSARPASQMFCCLTERFSCRIPPVVIRCVDPPGRNRIEVSRFYFNTIFEVIDNNTVDHHHFCTAIVVISKIPQIKFAVFPDGPDIEPIVFASGGSIPWYPGFRHSNQL